MPVCYEYSNIEWKASLFFFEWIRLLKDGRWKIEDVSDVSVFSNNYLKYSIVNFLSILSLFQCLYIVRFKWDIVLSSSYEGSDNRWYTMWCLREGTSTHLNCVWLYQRWGKFCRLWTLWVSTFKSWNCITLNLLCKI